MFSNRNIIMFLVGAAVVGFFLDQRRQRMQSREANNVPTNTGVVIALEPEATPEVAG